jgi:hypothetical protein
MTNPTDGGNARDGGGKFLAGNKLGGRKQLPDWFKDRGEDALRTLLAAATGIASDGDPPAARELAAFGGCKDSVRVDAAKVIADRLYGKAPDVVEMSGDMAVGLIRRIVVDKGDADS